MAFCNACGAEVPENARFCQNCGASLVPVDDTSASANPMMAPQPVYPSPYLPTYGAAPPAYPPSPYPVAPGYAAPPTRSGKAIAGFWIGLASIPCCILSWMGVIVGVVGLIFGLLGLRETRHFAAISGETPTRFGQRQAIIGVVCAIVGIAASVIVLVYLLNNLDKYGITFSK